MARGKRIALVGTFPPRRCGIATFTRDLGVALAAGNPAACCEVVALSDTFGVYDYPDAVAEEIAQDSLQAYVEAARRLRARGVDLVCVQHEFGIFGGAAGAHLLAFLDELRCPVVTTLHTVLEHPNPDQRRVMDRLIARSARLVVMSPKGRDILQRAFCAPPRKIAVIPHGAPDRAFTPAAHMKARCGLDGREVVLTSGLLSPNKGVETMIRALPRVVAARPNALYLLLGATHPHLLARDGESYRESLQALAASLGVADNVRFVNAYVGVDELVDYLIAADVYVTPYLSEAQITSGTLAYALALGKPIVSTPYWHAEELLRDGVGVLTPFSDAAALGEAVVALLDDHGAREALGRRAYAKGRRTVWSAVGDAYWRLFDQVRDEMRPEVRAPARRFSAPSPPTRAIERMTDHCGMFQHARFAAPDRNHGYCLDDNARALILTQHAPGPVLDRFAWVYAAFIEHAWNPDAGRFRNFMSYDRRWLEDVGSEDSCGRGLWALGETAFTAKDEDLKRWALHLVERAAPHLTALRAPRAKAFAMLGLSRLLAMGDTRWRDFLHAAAQSLCEGHASARRPDWDWIEPWLAYDNARLPQALLRAGQALGDGELVDCGFRSLRWLTRVQTAPSGCFRPVGSRELGCAYAQPVQFDQQPLEAVATIDACAAAYDVSGDRTWRDEMDRAFGWYLGENDLGVCLMTEDGGCYDGLGPEGPNLNQGAESILAFQLASAAVAARERRDKAANGRLPRRETAHARGIERLAPRIVAPSP
ncbi:MAG: glycosyltransferase [Hyphomonadaceae bacterium]|nr:glycosyltransferase [Hyphomonadaceae bacterium]